MFCPRKVYLMLIHMTNQLNFSTFHFLTENTGIISTPILFGITLALSVSAFTIPLFIPWMLKLKSKSRTNVLSVSGKGCLEVDSSYKNVRDLSLQTETNLTQNISYGCATINKSSV